MIEEPKPQRKLPEIKYQWARNDKGEVLKITDITADNRNQRFTCINCHCQAREMSPVLRKDPKYRAYFRHKSKEHACSYESYLHAVCKEILQYRFEHSNSWIIKYEKEESCMQSSNCRLASFHDVCKKKRSFLAEVDLKQLYDTCTLEKEYKGYRADVLLTNSKNPSIEPLFLEIAYKHLCEDKKIDAGIQIIEILVNAEDDAERELTESESVRFYGFERHIEKKGHEVNRVRFLRQHGKYKILADVVPCNEAKREENCVYEIRRPGTIKTDLALALAARDIPDFRSCFTCRNARQCYILIDVGLHRAQQTVLARFMNPQEQILLGMDDDCSKYQNTVKRHYEYYNAEAQRTISGNVGTFATWSRPLSAPPTELTLF